MTDNNQGLLKKIAAVIDAYALVHGVVGYTRSSSFAGDISSTLPITCDMIVHVSDTMGQELEYRNALSYAARFMKTYSSSYLSTKLVGWIPVVGSSVSESMFYDVARDIGWVTYLLLNDNAKLEFSDDDLPSLIRRGRKTRISLSDQDKKSFASLYKDISSKVRPHLTSDEISRLSMEITRIK